MIAAATPTRRSLIGLGTLLTAAALAVGPAALASAAPASTPQGFATSVDAPDFDSFLVSVVQDSGSYWQGQLGPKTWRQVHYAILDSGESMQTGCSDIAGDPDEFAGDVPASFCPQDMTIYLSSPWLHEHIWNEGAGSSDFGVAVAIAHEMGHAVQTDLGITEPVGSTTVSSIELQADCLAGVWSAAKGQQQGLDASDIPEALTAVWGVGDYDFESVGHHGTPAERTSAFLTGYVSGDAGRCSLDLPGAM